MLKELIWVGLGGFAGSALRYLVSSMLAGANVFFSLPLGTFTVNVFGSLLIGFLLVLTRESQWHHLAVIGFCGGFTTFSTFSAELLALLRTGSYTTAAIYAAASVVVCVACVWLGLAAGEKILIDNN